LRKARGKGGTGPLGVLAASGEALVEVIEED